MHEETHTFTEEELDSIVAALESYYDSWRATDVETPDDEGKEQLAEDMLDLFSSYSAYLVYNQEIVLARHQP